MTTFTQKAIRAEFRSMLEEMPFDKITVTELVRRCEISSNTFYYHYKDINDLLDQWFAHEYKQFPEVTVETAVDTAKEFLRYCKKNRKIVYHLSDSFSRDRIERYFFVNEKLLIENYIKERAGDVVLSDKTVRQLAEFCDYSLVGFFLKFLWYRMDVDIDEAVDEFMTLFHRSIDATINEHS